MIFSGVINYILFEVFFSRFLSRKTSWKRSFKQNLYFVFWGAWSRKLTLIRNSVNFASQFRTDILYCDSCLQISWMIETLAHVVSLFPWPFILAIGTYKHDIPRRLQELYELWTNQKLQRSYAFKRFSPIHFPRKIPGGVLPYMGYMGMCRCEGYGFQAVYSRIGYINQNIWV